MDSAYSIKTCKDLEQQFIDIKLHRPMNIERYDEGDILIYDMTAVIGEKNGGKARVTLKIDKFVGGGFAGQVYRVIITSIEGSPVDGLTVGSKYAMKILIPPSRGSLFFRNLIYNIGFQGPFQLQVNESAARSGAIWQKFIKRAAGLKFNDEKTVNDIHAIFVDDVLGSCGELSDWVDGRTWRLEVDDHLDTLKKWKKGKQVNDKNLGSPEFRFKKQFMNDFVELLHEIGAHEFARQYEWSTCKSQPNALKRTDAEDDPSKGLVAVDFRAGLALLPFLPMSPGDISLIFKGLARGSLVQFDRGCINTLEAYVNKHKDSFSDMLYLIDELRDVEKIYRNSTPDITHNHVRLLYSPTLWSTMIKSTITGWRIRNSIDTKSEENLQKNIPLTFLLFILGLIPFVGKVFKKLIAHDLWRKHYGHLFSSIGYFSNAIKGKIIEKAISWHRAERITEQSALNMPKSFLFFLMHLPLSLLPMGIHKVLTNFDYFKERLYYIVIRPFKLYFNAEERELWLKEMVAEGEKKHIISEEDRLEILSQLDEPFIQKYLKSLAVHVMTVPITQVVSVAIAVLYVLMHPEMPRTQSWGIGLGIIALFQVIPISPGSLTRGLYVLYLVIKERNFKDYNIAVFLGFFKYIGYLAFPIQMAYRYPTLARFMAGHSATEAVHIIPVFGESGALMEHWVFCLFYNSPLTLRRKMQERAEKRALMKPRYWHAPIYSIIIASLLGYVDYMYKNMCGTLPSISDIAPVMVLLPAIIGFAIASGCKGASMMKRIVVATITGIISGILYSSITYGYLNSNVQFIITDLYNSVWRMFTIGVFAGIGAIVEEIR